LLRQYLAERQGSENLRQFFTRHTDTELREFLAGEPVDAVSRDVPAAIAPGALAQSAGGEGD
jgi:hypothetical protein